jgi:predicted metalloprotease with PDZ domain
MHPIEYTVDLADRHAHLYAVEARFPVGNAEIDLQLPVWTPGSYLIREYQRHLQELVCDDGDGRLLPVTKIDKATWRVDARSAQRVRARYRVYAYDLTVRAAHLDDTHGYFNGAPLFLYHEALRKQPARVAVNAPAGWRVTVELPFDNGAFVARDYDELVDSPFECGTHELVQFTAQGRPHRIAIWGKVDKARDELVVDVTKIIDAAAAIFGGVPYDAYTFILLASPNAYGGLEHARSCTLLASPFTFSPRKKYEEFLELVSHEFFHLWNVKRIHPTALGPFDYQREAYTRALWVMEGVTSYYDRHLLVRAGLQAPRRYLDKLGEELGKIAATPGARRQSLEESSFDAWIKLYRPDENSVNSTISYYLKGGVVALLLDLEIRSRTIHHGGGARSLDDVMRLLWRRFGSRGEGFPDGAVQALVEEAAGVPLGELFDRFVRGRDELDAAPLFATVGLSVKASWAEEPPPGATPAWLGATFKDDHGAVLVTGALAGGPAAKDGLYANDQILALDGFRVDAASLKERLATRRPGERVKLTLFRRDELRTVELTLTERPKDKYEVVAVDAPTDAQRAAFLAWTGHPLPEEEG